jgi:putative heme-binding domain-containing protein
LLESGNDTLEQAVLGVLRARPAWADEIAGRLASWLAEPKLSMDREADVRTAIRAFWSNNAVVRVVADALRDRHVESRNKMVALESIAQTDADKLPEPWIDALSICLNDTDKDVVRQAIATVSACNLDSFNSSLLRLAQSATEPNPLRLAAAVALLRHAQKVPGDVFELLCQECSDNVDAVNRLASAQALGSAHLSDEQRLRLTQLVAAAGPIELPALLGAFDGDSNAQIGEQLIRSLEDNSELDALPAGRLEPALRAYPAAVQSAAAPLLKKLGANSSERADRMRELSKELTGGNPQKGHEVFFGQQAACSACHRIGNQGSSIGPDLSRIGEIRATRDLIESVVFPSSSFARGFEPVVVITRDGKSISGTMSRETAQAIYIRSADRTETRIARSDIDTLTPDTLSIMPQGLDKQLTIDQLRDLIAFLGSLKQ